MCQVHLKRMTEEIGNYRRNTLITVPEQESPEFLKRFCLLNPVFACWLNKGMKRRDRHSLWCLSLLSITAPLRSWMRPLFHTNAIINCFNRHAHCRAPTSAPIYISKRPARIYMNASQLTNSEPFVRRAGSPLPQNERNAISQPAQRPPASLQQKRPPVQPTSINPRSHELRVLCSVPYSQLPVSSPLMRRSAAPAASPLHFVAAQAFTRRACCKHWRK